MAGASLVRRAPLVSYVALAYLFTWGIGVVLLAERRGWAETGVSGRWEAVAAFGPLIAALVVAGVLAGREGVRTILASLMRWRVGGGWLLFSCLSPFALLAVAALILRAGTGEWPDTTALSAGRLAAAAGIVELVVISGLAQGLGEEPGWRGFMLPRLRLRFSPLVATLVLFPSWLVWHLPAFLGRPEFGVAQWFAFSAGVLSAAVWLTFIWEGTKSTLMAVIWHALINVARGIALAISTPMFLAMSTLVLVGAVMIVASWNRGQFTQSGAIT
jgi:membrane protease YdiL (CAAX protease family)